MARRSREPSAFNNATWEKFGADWLLRLPGVQLEVTKHLDRKVSITITRTEGGGPVYIAAHLTQEQWNAMRALPVSSPFTTSENEGGGANEAE